MPLKPVEDHDQDAELEASLAEAMRDVKPQQPVARPRQGLVEQNVSSVETLIGKLKAREIDLENQIAEKQDELRLTRRSIAAFTVTLRMLT